MKKIIIGAFVMLIAFGSVVGQEKQEHKRNHKGYGRGTEQLNLSADQKVQMKVINDEFRNQMQELKKNENITVKDLKTRKEELSKSHKERIQGILTADQKIQFEKMKQEHRSEGKGKKGKTKHGRGYGEGKMESMTERLDLSKEQTEKLKAFRSGNSEKIKNIRSNESLTQEQKKEQMKELMKKQKDEMKSILTEEQLKKMDELKSNRNKKVK